MRRTKLVELDPKWATSHAVYAAGGDPDMISFDCPEADGGCGSRHSIPVTPDRAGEPAHGTRWRRQGDDLATMTIIPSIRCSGACRMHVEIVAGEVKFCADSKSGPDWSKAGA